MLVFLRSTKTGPFLDSRTPTIIDEFRMFPSNALVSDQLIYLQFLGILSPKISLNTPNYASYSC